MTKSSFQVVSMRVNENNLVMPNHLSANHKEAQGEGEGEKATLYCRNAALKCCLSCALHYALLLFVSLLISLRQQGIW